MARGTEKQQQPERASRATTMRRMTNVLERMAKLDLDDPHLTQRLRSLKESAAFALQEYRFSGDAKMPTGLTSPASDQRTRGELMLERIHRYLPEIHKIEERGITVSEKVAEALNQGNVESPSGKPWTGAMVRGLKTRARSLDKEAE